MLNKKKLTAYTFIILIISFFYGVLYTVIDLHKNERINTILQTHLNNLELHYEIITHYQQQLAKSNYEEIINDSKFIDLYAKLAVATDKEQKVIREKLIEHLTKRHERLKKYGVLQFHFVFANNVTSLRMHKQKKYADDLTDIRGDFKYVNEKLIPVSGFIQGRSAHGFRNVYPILDFNGNHLGAFEISFSGESFQNEMTNISKIHTHFLLDKTINEMKMWSLKDTITKYIQSTEHNNYMVSKTKNHKLRQCISSMDGYFNGSQEEINEGIQGAKKFSLYVRTPYDKIDIVSFLPIKGFNGNTNLAWVISYTENASILSILTTSLMVQIVGFLLLVILGFFISKYISNQIKSSENIHRKAYTDGLTGVSNRNKFDEKIKEEFERSIRYNNRFSLALLDIDNFKTFNDTYGHLTGDDILILLAQTLNKEVRNIDTFARWGGEEFFIIFPETNLKKAEAICEKLRKKIERLQHKEVNSITISIGVTTHQENDTIEDIISRCDDALYKAKDSGRNQVCTK